MISLVVVILFIGLNLELVELGSLALNSRLLGAIALLFSPVHDDHDAWPRRSSRQLNVIMTSPGYSLPLPLVVVAALEFLKRKIF